MIRGKVERDLLKISKIKTDGWENATAFIGNQPGGYQVGKKRVYSVDLKKNTFVF